MKQPASAFPYPSAAVQTQSFSSNLSTRSPTPSRLPRPIVTVFKTLIGAVKEFFYTDLIGSVPSGATSTYVGAFIPVLGALGVVSVMWLMQLKSYGPGLGGLTEEVDRQVPWIPRR